MIKIKHLSGALRNEEQEIFDDNRERITFGRAKSCDVIFPPEETVVGREHFALVRKPSGDWSIDLFGDHYVEVNGVEAQPGQPVPKDAKFRLGTKKGPSFQVISEPVAMKPGALTAPQKERVPLPVRLRRNARAGIAAFLVLAVAGLGWVYYDQQQKEEAAQRLEEAERRLGESVKELEKKAREQEAELREAASKEISDEAQQRLVRATFLVMQQDKQGRDFAQGTAWAIGPSLLATNAHIAELRIESLGKGGKLLVRAPGANGEVFEVVEVKIHPGWNLFPDYTKDLIMMSEGVAGVVRLKTMEQYDVALLRIDGEVSPDAILQVAPIEELRALKRGTALASAGYPSESVGHTEALTMGATPQLGFGTIRALTDYFNLPTEDVDQRRLIHHSLPVTGGASGSPIIGPSGHVVGIVSAASFLFSEEFRIPNAVMINFGQRADLATDLIEEREEMALAGDQAYWDKQIARFKLGAETIIPAALGMIEPPQADATLELVSEERGVLSEADVVERDDLRYRIKAHKVTVDAGVPVVFLAYPQRYELWLFYQGEDFSVKAENKEQTLCPTISYTADADETGYIVVQGGDTDTPYIVRTYRWKTAES